MCFYFQEKINKSKRKLILLLNFINQLKVKPQIIITRDFILYSIIFINFEPTIQVPILKPKKCSIIEYNAI